VYASALPFIAAMARGQNPSLEVTSRTPNGSRSVRRLRRSGQVPGVVYGGGDGPAPFAVDARRLRLALAQRGAVLDLVIDGGKAQPVIIKDQQHHPVRGELIHIDLLRVRLDKPIQSTVPLELEGVEESPGVKEGGVMEHITRELNIEALPNDIPDVIRFDVSGMDLNETATLEALSPPAGVTLLDDPEETVIATVAIPRVVEEEEIETETELVGEEAEEVEAEAPAEGEAPVEGEGAEAPAEGESEGE
jgi:large subunit ribosomal protein L25